MLFNKNIFFFLKISFELFCSWVKNRDTNRIVGLVYRYSPNIYTQTDDQPQLSDAIFIFLAQLSQNGKQRIVGY